MKIYLRNPKSIVPIHTQIALIVSIYIKKKVCLFFIRFHIQRGIRRTFFRQYSSRPGAGQRLPLRPKPLTLHGETGSHMFMPYHSHGYGSVIAPLHEPIYKRAEVIYLGVFKDADSKNDVHFPRNLIG